MYIPQSYPELFKATDLWCYDNERALQYYGHISTWNISKITRLDYLFHYKFDFNDDITKWDVSNVISMYGMFSYAKSFNQPIGNWDISNVQNMTSMFNRAENFNQSLEKWNLDNVQYKQYIFFAPLPQHSCRLATISSSLFVSANVFRDGR